VKWATRPGCHVDRAACAWLIRRFVDPEAEFLFVEEAAQVPDGATPFDMRGVPLSHRGGGCTFETMLAHFRLDDAALAAVGRIVHEADLADERYDAPEAPGLDLLIRGLGLLHADAALLRVTDALFEGLYAAVKERQAAIPNPG
jgi:hypothetical protein